MDTSIVSKFKKTDVSSLPNFHSLTTPLEMGLWVLMAAKENGIATELSGEEIASVVTGVYETSVTLKAITGALNRAGKKVHVVRSGKPVRFSIMQEGKKFLSKGKAGEFELFYFEPGKKFGTKRLLSDDILGRLKGGLRIVDPYFGERALDILNGKGRDVQFLTRLANLQPKDQNRLTREIQDFKGENPRVEFRNYAAQDIHDRYIISEDALVLLGHSISSLGGKESFAIVLSKSLSRNVFEAMVENFNRRWKQGVKI